jgi:hypothetical protein
VSIELLERVPASGSLVIRKLIRRALAIWRSIVFCRRRRLAAERCWRPLRGACSRRARVGTVSVAQDTTEINFGPAAGPSAAGSTRPLRRRARRKLKRLKAGPTQAGAWLRRVAQQEPDLFAHWAVTFAGMAER